MATKNMALTEVIQEIQAHCFNERWGDAENLVNVALGQHPDDPILLFYAGNVMANTHRYGFGIQILKAACDLLPDMYEAWANLGGCYRREHRLKEARDAFGKAIAIKDTDPAVFANISACYINEGCAAEGEGYARRALELQPNNALASWNLSLLLLEQGKWAEGFGRYAQGENTKKRLYRTYWSGGNTPVLYDLDDLKEDETVVIHGEQGLGDEVMFASILPDFIEYRENQARDRGERESNVWRNTRVIYECHSALEGLMRRSFPGLEVHGTRDKEFVHWAGEREVHWSCPIGNLGKFFRNKDQDFLDHRGYLSPNKELSKLYRRQLEISANGRPIIGLGWTGGIRNTQAEYRSIPLVDLRPLLDEDALFISLQHEEDEKEVDEFMALSGIRIERFPQASHSSSIDKVCALLSACDLVITVNNSLHHFCGSIGQPCWTLTPKAAAWRYAPMDWTQSIWYPRTCTIFRQGDDQDWGPVIQNVANALKTWRRAAA